MRILIASLQVSQSGSKGHLHPAVELALESRRRGHEVAILPFPSPLGRDDQEQLARAQIQYVAPPPLPFGIVKSPEELGMLARDPERVHEAYDSFLVAPLIYQFEKVVGLMRNLRPDVVIYDLLVYVAPLAARKLGIPDMGFCAGLKLIAPEPFQAVYQQIGTKLRPKIDQFLKDRSLRAGFHHLELLSDNVQCVFTLPELVGNPEFGNQKVHLVGPIHTSVDRGDQASKTIGAPADSVILSFGSVLDPADFMPITLAVIEATKDIGLSLIIGSRKLSQSALPRHVTVHEYLPIPQLIKKAAAFIHHGGANSFSEAVCSGANQILIPLTTDQPIQAEFLKRSGAGFTLTPDQVTAARIQSCLARFLDRNDPVHLAISDLAKVYQEHSGATNTIALAEDLYSCARSLSIGQGSKINLQTPLLEYPFSDKTPSVLLKLECSLPGGSYKMRGVKSYFKNTRQLPRQICVPSAGNLALATALEASAHGILCKAIVPTGISAIKRNKLRQAGAEITEEPFEKIWDLVLDTTLRTRTDFLHPLNPFLLSGYGEIVDELRVQCPRNHCIVVPYGLGGLAMAVVARLKQLDVKTPVYVCEIEGHAPFYRALAEGKPIPGAKLQSFIEALGTPCVVPKVFEKLKDRIAGSILVNENQVRQAIAELKASMKIRVEGAAGAAFAAAKILRTQTHESVVALLTGSNISEEFGE